jgi:hypothetical protein
MNSIESSGMSRRDAIRLGSTMAAVMAVPAFGQKNEATPEGAKSFPPMKLQDPTTKYPQPPFHEQQ